MVGLSLSRPHPRDSRRLSESSWLEGTTLLKIPCLALPRGWQLRVPLLAAYQCRLTIYTPETRTIRTLSPTTHYPSFQAMQPASASMGPKVSQRTGLEIRCPQADLLKITRLTSPSEVLGRPMLPIRQSSDSSLRGFPAFLVVGGLEAA